MKTVKLLSQAVFLLLLSISINSCKGDAGPAGEDGNANVQIIRFQSPQWTNPSGTYDLMELEIPQITQEDINYSAILYYINFGSDYTMLPAYNYVPGLGDDYTIRASTNFDGTSTVHIKRTTGLPDPTPSANFLKVVIIRPGELIQADGNSSGRPANTKQQVLNELENAGVDINDYQAVCEYYGVNP